MWFRYTQIYFKIFSQVIQVFIIFITELYNFIVNTQDYFAHIAIMIVSLGDSPTILTLTCFLNMPWQTQYRSKNLSWFSLYTDKGGLCYYARRKIFSYTLWVCNLWRIIPSLQRYRSKYINHRSHILSISMCVETPFYNASFIPYHALLIWYIFSSCVMHVETSFHADPLLLKHIFNTCAMSM